MLDLSLTTELKQHVKLVPKTSGGKDAPVDGVPVWTVVSGAGTVEPDADGLGAFIISTDAVDSTMTIYQVDADADLGSGVETISDTISLTTVAANAASLGLVADAAVPK